MTAKQHIHEAHAEIPRAAESPVDMEIFLEVAGNQKQIPETARHYLKQAREHLEKLRHAIAGGVAADVKNIAHKLAGSSAMCGMNALVASLRELEAMGHQGRLADAERVFARITQESARIEAFFKNNPETTNPAAALAGMKETKL